MVKNLPASAACAAVSSVLQGVKPVKTESGNIDRLFRYDAENAAFLMNVHFSQSFIP